MGGSWVGLGYGNEVGFVVKCIGIRIESMVEFWVWVWGYLGLGTQISGGGPPDPRYLGWVITLPAFLLFHRIHQKSDIF